MTVTKLQGDCRNILKTLDDKSVHCCVTSPPYYGLRDYGVDGQIGLEETLGEFIAELVGVFREVKRLLRDDGTLWLNLGDSYATRANGEHGKNTVAHNYWRQAVRPRSNGSNCQNGTKHKDMLGVPWRVAFALQQPWFRCKKCGVEYHTTSLGRFPSGQYFCPLCVELTELGISEKGWYLRQDIIWHKPNPMPESVRDRCTKAHEYIFLLSKSARYHYDMEAIKEPVSGTAHMRRGKKVPQGWNTAKGSHGSLHPDGRRKPGCGPKTAPAGSGIRANESFNAAVVDLIETRNKRSVWTVTTQPYSSAHFATFPEKLIEPCILAGCPAGETVLDPFGGSGTTGRVATRHKRDAILIELNPEYIALQDERCSKVQVNLF